MWSNESVSIEYRIWVGYNGEDVRLHGSYSSRDIAEREYATLKEYPHAIFHKITKILDRDNYVVDMKTQVLHEK